MNVDVCVVGAGFWGVATALAAERRGLRTMLVTDTSRCGASEAASGYTSPGWYKGIWAARAAESLADASLLYDFRPSPTKARVLSRDGRWSERSDWSLFSPQSFLARRTPDREGGVYRWWAGGGVELRGGEVVSARLTVLAIGAYTDAVLKASGLPELGVKALWGAGSVHSLHGPNVDLFEEGWLLMQRVTPYHAHTARVWGPSEVRVGESTDNTRGGAVSKLNKLTDELRLFPSRLPERHKLLIGPRPVLDQGPTVKQLAPGLVVATGGGKVGAALAFWAAKEALKFYA